MRLSRNSKTKTSGRAEVVKLRFFAGLTIEQVAQALGISISTAGSDWTYARCWLRLEIEAAEGDGHL